MLKTQSNMMAETLVAAALIVEDDDEMRALLKSLVLDLGYKQVFGVGRLEPALERLEYDAFSLAIVDLNLGDQDGVSLISAMRCNPRACVNAMPVLVASTAATGHRIQSALLAGADGFLCKPFSIANLKRQIRFAGTKAQARLKRPLDRTHSPTVLARTAGDVLVLD